MTIMGAPKKINDTVRSFMMKLYEEGHNDSHVAKMIGVCTKTIHNWKLGDEELFRDIKAAKDLRDNKVERALLSLALGYEYETTELKVVSRGNNQGSEVKRCKVMKKVAPSERAAEFWLRNRQQDRWRDRQEIDVKVSDNLSNAIMASRQRRLKDIDTALVAGVQDSDDRPDIDHNALDDKSEHDDGSKPLVSQADSDDLPHITNIIWGNADQRSSDLSNISEKTDTPPPRPRLDLKPHDLRNPPKIAKGKNAFPKKSGNRTIEPTETSKGKPIPKKNKQSEQVVGVHSTGGEYPDPNSPVIATTSPDEEARLIIEKDATMDREVVINIINTTPEVAE